MNAVENCRQCDRLVEYLADVKQSYPGYHCKPVKAFGDDNARLLIVGLAPGLHGANATGIPFTGDASGALLFQMLHQFKFSSQVQSSTDDSFKLYDCRITNAVKCLPPQNKPTALEINQCNPFLKHEINELKKNSVILALGQLAHKALIKTLDLKQADFRFGHAAEFELPNQLTLIDSYHCSRYNTQTKRLTEAMFRDVFKRIRQLLSDE